MSSRMKRVVITFLVVVILSSGMGIGPASAQGAIVYHSESFDVEAEFRYTDECTSDYYVIRVYQTTSRTAGKPATSGGLAQVTIVHFDRCEYANGYVARVWKILEPGEFTIDRNLSTAALSIVSPLAINNIIGPTVAVNVQWTQVGKPQKTVENVGKPGCPDSYHSKTTFRPAVASAVITGGGITYLDQANMEGFMRSVKGEVIANPKCRLP